MQESTIRKGKIIGRTATLVFALLLILIAFCTPMDIFGMYHMFSVHMAQHLLLSLAAPPLVLLGLAPQRISAFFARYPKFARGIKFLTIPFVASILFNGNIWIWHAPALMRIMMGNELIHSLTNLLYLLTGLLFWLPLVGPLPPGAQPLSIGKKLIYLFFSDMPMMLIGAGMTFAPPLYSFPMANPNMNMLATADDQQLAGLLM